MKLDILAFGAHPDDVELTCSGTIISHVKQGKRVGIVDLTQGELGTRGTPEIRLKEAKESAKILGVSTRVNLGFEDVYFSNDKAHQLEIIKMIREFQPEIVLANAIRDRHPDHPKAAQLVKQSCFMAGLQKIVTKFENKQQNAWRPKAVYHYIQSSYVEPDFVVDVTPYWDQRMKSVMAFKSQFFDPSNKEPETFISSKQFQDFLSARGVDFGKTIGVKYGEGFTANRFPGVKNLFDLI